MDAAKAHQLWEASVLPAICEYTTIPCLSPDFDAQWERSRHLHEAASLLARWCEERKVPAMHVDVLSPPGRTPMVVVEVAGRGQARGTVVVYGHLDKQPPFEGWRTGLGPYTPVREGDRLYGRGTADDGYACFAALSALEMLADAELDHPRVLVLIEASEESGSPDLAVYLAELADRIADPRLVVCLDSGGLSYDRLWLTTSLRGNLVATLAVEVLTEGVHSGAAGGIVPTSFRLLRQLLDRVEDSASGEIRLAELHADVPAGHADPTAAGWSALTSFPIVPGLVLCGEDDAERLVRRAWAPSLTVTGMDGVPAVRDGGNVLRPSTTAKLSVRLPPSVKAAEAARTLEAALVADPPNGAKVRVHVETPATGWAAPPVPAWVTDAFAAASREVLGNPPGSFGEGGTIPFLAMLSERYPEVPLVATGVLGPGSNAHGPNEYLHLPTAEAVTVATARLVASAAAGGSR